ncbi:MULTISPECIES: hypothetical protein [Streptomycetaceae]|uniref:Amidotransferase n=2 Tax=Kitasatospora TaxID=2063 RepID=A0A919FCY3_9ACTN|nr:MULTISPECIES: hypothetical protein [Streptomycetaceae]MCX5213506.1 hypothetical protein [Kitasatospora sp. NBC_00240]MDQ0307756.1 uncharacterized protein HemX [Kitasatospora herbaricolor]GGV26295.1 hypothetical protein GCM10010495_47850 [Kitasatospora herbaricolor]GHH60732.1 hypothetical protein GCM10018781_05950 [Kitasatospora indigofera]
MSKAATLLIIAGLFLSGGVYSFWKQKQSKSLVAVLAIGAALCLVSGVMRL